MMNNCVSLYLNHDDCNNKHMMALFPTSKEPRSCFLVVHIVHDIWAHKWVCIILVSFEYSVFLSFFQRIVHFCRFVSCWKWSVRHTAVRCSIALSLSLFQSDFVCKLCRYYRLRHSVAMQNYFVHRTYSLSMQSSCTQAVLCVSCKSWY